MATISTSAWVIRKGSLRDPGPAELLRETISFGGLEDQEVLAEPIYGCWEANMTHAVERDPVDICRQRKEDYVVLGNAAVVRILKVGSAVESVREGDMCGLVCIGTQDRWGNMLKVLGYDARHSTGMLAKRVKLLERQVVRLPLGTRHSYQQWAAFGVRYATAWANWKIAYNTFRLHADEADCPVPHVWGWGGGVALAELGLAKLAGCRTAMMTSRDERKEIIRQHGIEPIDRRNFPNLFFDEERYATDRSYKREYLKSEGAFMKEVRRVTGDEKVAIFIDNIGTPVFKATLKALRIQGVVTTAGWKDGMELKLNRAMECMGRHTHVHTHGSTYAQGVSSMEFAEETGWMPAVDEKVYSWDEIPKLAEDFACGEIISYFPIYQVNPL